MNVPIGRGLLVQQVEPNSLSGQVSYNGGDGLGVIINREIILSGDITTGINGIKIAPDASLEEAGLFLTIQKTVEPLM